jgi:hypothetical protein
MVACRHKVFPMPIRVHTSTQAAAQPCQQHAEYTCWQLMLLMLSCLCCLPTGGFLLSVVHSSRPHRLQATTWVAGYGQKRVGCTPLTILCFASTFFLALHSTTGRFRQCSLPLQGVVPGSSQLVMIL